jgi:hypothetical protein
MARRRGRRGRVGGASAAAGVGYQEGVTAWLAVHLLAEDQAPPLRSLEATVRVTSTASETDQPIDDVNVRTTGPTLYVQAKRAVPQIVDRAGSDFTDFVEQAVDQHLSLSESEPPAPARYVLATSPDATRAVRHELRLVLDDLRDAPRDADVWSFGSTAAKRAALTTTASIVRRLLCEPGEEPADPLVREVLERIVVWEVDVDGSARSTAINLLAASVVTSSTTASEAWAILERRGRRAMERHETLDLHGWRRALEMEGVELGTIPSHLADTGRLRARSVAALADLERHAVLKLGGTQIGIDREVIAVAAGLAGAGPLLVTGEPGSGKSAVLAGVARRLERDGSEVLVLDAEALAAGSIGELSRELRLDHDLDEVLDSWPGRGRRYLVVDGLDETRGRPAVPALRRLIERILTSGSWVPVVAVRRFDLRYSSELRDLFRGAAPASAFADPEFSETRHVVVGDVSDAELGQVEARAPELGRMARHPRAGELLRRPIHLQLAAELVTRGVEADLEHLRTQVQLLDLYWSRVVEVPVEGRGSREGVLSRAGRLAVSERRMSLPRADLDAVDAVATADLLSRGVLVEGEAQLGTGRLIRFLHALVGDYAIARLLIRDTDTAEALLVDDPVNALFLRPSLELWLTRLWHSQPTRQAFWDVAIHLAGRTGVPEIAKLIAPTLAADLWRDLGELEALVTALATPQRDGALTALRHLIACLTTPPHPPVAGSEASPWGSLAVRLTADLAADLVFPTRLLVTLLSDRAGDLTPPQAAATGQAARRLLAWLWQTDHPDLFSAGLAIGAVCQTIASDPVEAAALLRRGLCRRHVERRGYEELRHYGERIADLEAARGLVVALYTAAFRFEDTAGSEPTMLRSGPVLPLISNRRQEFQGARYVLSEAFRGIAERHPEVATEALLRVLRASRDLRSQRSTPRPYRRFTVDGVESRIRDEWSAHSVGWLMDHGEEATMIAAWSAALADLAERTDPRLSGVIATFLEFNRTYAGWRVLIEAAAREDRLLDPVVRLVAAAPAVLSASILGGSLCRLAEAAHSRPELTPLLRAAFASLDEPTRSSLTTCLDGAAGSFAEDDEETDVEAEPAVRRTSPAAGAGASRQVLAEWCEAPDDAMPAADERVRAAFADLVGSLPEHHPDADEDWVLISRAAARLAQVDMDCSTDDARLVATVLLRVLASARWTHDSWDGEEDLATIPAHSCVLNAVVGIARLYGSGRCEDLVSASVIQSIAGHDLPWARWQLARASSLFVGRDPDLAWSTLDRLASDPVARVAADAVWIATDLRRQSPTNARRTLDRAVSSHATRSKLVGDAVLALAGFLVVDGFEELDRFRSLLAAVERLADVGPLLHALRPLITPPADGDDRGGDRHRKVLGLLREVGTLAASRFEDARREWESGGEVAQERARDAALALDSVITEIYFASGAYRPQDGEPRATPEQMTVLFDEILADLRSLLPHLPAPAIHHVVEIAAANAEARPREAFLLIGDAVRAAGTVGYATDSLAKDLVLGIARTYMADRTELFQGATEPARAMQAALVTILDSFVSVGWPDARAMAYRLHEVLR